MSKSTRQVGIEVFVGVCACAGVYLFVVQPLNRNLAEVTAETARLQAQIARDSQLQITPGQSEKLRADAARRMQAVLERAASAKDESATFGALMSLATRHGVRVEQLQPSTPRTLKTKAAEAALPSPQHAFPGPPGASASISSPSAPAAAAQPFKERRSAVSMTIAGDFGRVLAFVRALERDAGFTSVRTVRLMPLTDGAADRVQASIETEHVWVEQASPAVAGAEGHR